MRLLAKIACGATTALILAVTLVPDPRQVGYLPVWCVFCGEHATADALANVILFIPLGAALAWWRPGTRAWYFGPALSLGIELAQRFIAGRDASLGDVLTNSAGTLIGWMGWRYVASGAAWPRPRSWPVAAGAFGAVVAATSWLMQPAPTMAAYYGQWTPVLAHLEWYRGRVLGASLDQDSLKAGRLGDPVPVREAMSGRRTLHARLIAGPRSTALALLVAVFDSLKREILLLGLDGDAVVLRYRRQSAAWRLDAPDVRFEYLARRWSAGDTILISVARMPGAACVRTGQETHCVAGVTPGWGWSLLYYPDSFSHLARATLSLLWLFGLMLLLGWCAGTVRAGLAGSAVALATLVTLPPLIGGAGSPPLELLAALLGLPVGLQLRRWASRAAQPATILATTLTQRSMRS